MALHPEVESAVEDICNECIVTDQSKAPISIGLDRVEMSESIKDKIQEEFDEVYNMFDFTNKGFEIFRRWFIDGRLFYHMIVDGKNTKKGIADIRYVDPTKIKKVIEIKKDTETVNTREDKQSATIIKKDEEYFLYREKENAGEGIKIAKEAICYVTSGLYDAGNKKVISYLHKAIKPLNQLRMIEDAAVIYRISRAPERRVFYIDVGNLPKTKAEQYVKSIMNKFKNKLTYDATTGAIRDDKRHMSMLEDYWLPRREGGKGTEISTINGGQNLGEMEDVEYFQKKLYQSLNVPMTRMDTQNEFNLGKSSEITRDEVKFMKYIDRLRNKFNQLFITVLKTQCLLKGIMTEDEWFDIQNDIEFVYAKDNYFSELTEFEILSERLSILREVSDYVGKYYSHDWIRKNLLKQSDEDIEMMDEQIAQEIQDGKINPEEDSRF